MEAIDVSVENHGSIFIVQPLSEAANDWIAEHVGDDAQWFGGGLAVGHHYVGDLVQGMIDDGLIVR